MANLSNIVRNRQALADGLSIVDPYDINFVLADSNLEKGCITTIASSWCSTEYCWTAPASGMAEIEIWGAGGNGAGICCCGMGVPGNPGAYAKKIVQLEAGSFICGLAANAPPQNVTCVSPVGGVTTADVCISPSEIINMSAESGDSAKVACDAAVGSMYTCLRTFYGLTGTEEGTGCGWVCNWNGTTPLPQAIGGDINCAGGVSKIFIGDCSSFATTTHCNYTAIPPGLVNKTGLHLKSIFATGTCVSESSEHGYVAALMSLGQAPGPSHTMLGYCYASDRWCTCYKHIGCVPYLPPTIPAVAPLLCGGMIGTGMRGGGGKVRIRFIADE